MNRLCRFLLMLDLALDSPSKRHIAGGILISMAFMFGGMAVTVLTVSPSETPNEDDVIDAESYVIEEEPE